MLKKIIRVLTITLTIMILVLVCKLLRNIKINDASQIKSAFVGDEFSLSKKEKNSHIAMRHNAILAINGATAGFNERSYVIRDGVIYRDTRLDCDSLVIQKNGDFRIYNEQLIGEELVEKGAKHTGDFGLDLIRNGEIVDYGDTCYKDNLAPRTVIGQKGTLEYVILVVDGRSKASVRMSHYDTAVKLEIRRGDSTTLYFNGEVLITYRI